MATTLLVSALVTQAMLVPVVGTGAAGASEWPGSHGPDLFGPLAALFAGRRVVVVTLFCSSPVQGTES